jgi:serine/threonine protein kinase
LAFGRNCPPAPAARRSAQNRTELTPRYCPKFERSALIYRNGGNTDAVCFGSFGSIPRVFLPDAGTEGAERFGRGRVADRQRAGTPSHMAPEQAADEVARVARRSDVFGLASIIFEIPTGERVYTGSDSMEVIRKAMAGDTAEAPEADPKLVDDRQAGHRYNAACAAALAGTGQGKDVPPPDDAAKARLRRQARGWLEAEWIAWTRLLESGPPQARPLIAQTLRQWKQDSDLAGIRNAEDLAKLPSDEQKAWRTLWADVDSLLMRSGA